ncbi:MAG: aminotransferase class IV [Chitinophagaceae bacterium]|nr:aminotransferase class IV [Chitinophagaceae bacterium]
MDLICYLNGQFIPLDSAGLPVGDLGIQRGYGIFDFVRVTNGRALFLDDHLERFYHSAEKMRLPVGRTKDELKEAIDRLIKQNQLPDAGLRILLTGGISPDGYQIVQPNLTIIQQPLAPPPAQLPSPYKLVTCEYQREMPEIKTTHYLMAVWLYPWMKEQGADDVLYRQNGFVSECPRSNFFIVTKDDRIVTPAANILRGITRKQILKVAAAHHLPIEEASISLGDLRLAREAFISSSTKRIIPVQQVDDISFHSNELSRRLFELLVEEEAASY